jgi:DNA-binding NarL/FixJ family response regulator
MIGVAVLDDHPMVRAGLHTLLTTEQDMQPAGFAADEEQLWPRQRTRRGHADRSERAPHSRSLNSAFS